MASRPDPNRAFFSALAAKGVPALEELPPHFRTQRHIGSTQEEIPRGVYEQFEEDVERSNLSERGWELALITAFPNLAKTHERRFLEDSQTPDEPSVVDMVHGTPTFADLAQPVVDAIQAPGKAIASGVKQAGTAVADAARTTMEALPEAFDVVSGVAHDAGNFLAAPFAGHLAGEKPLGENTGTQSADVFEELSAGKDALTDILRQQFLQPGTIPQEGAGIQPQDLTGLQSEPEGEFSALAGLSTVSSFLDRPKAFINSLVGEATDPVDLAINASAVGVVGKPLKMRPKDLQAQRLTQSLKEFGDEMVAMTNGRLSPFKPRTSSALSLQAPFKGATKAAAKAPLKGAAKGAPLESPLREPLRQDLAMMIQSPNGPVTFPSMPVRGPFQEKFANMRNRMFRGAREVLERFGTPGRTAAQLLDKRDINVEMGAVKSFEKLELQAERLFGKRSAFSLKGNNPLATPGLVKRYKVRQEVGDAITDYMATHGNAEYVRRVHPRLTDKEFAQVKEMSEALFRDGTFVGSSHPGVRGLSVTNHITGEVKPVGQPSMFMPQIPVKEVAQNKLRGKQFDLILREARKTNPHLRAEDLRKQLKGMADIDPKARRYSGLEDAHILDPTEGLTVSAAKTYRKLGYEDDAMRAVLRYNVGALRRGEEELIVPQLNVLKKSIDDTFASKFGSQSNIGSRLIDHDLEINQIGLLDQNVHGSLAKVISRVLSANTAHLLGLSAIPQFNQLTQIAGRGGVANTLKGLLRIRGIEGLGKGTRIEYASGAIFNNLINEFMNPSHAFSHWAQANLRMAGFTASERFLRTTAAITGGHHIQHSVRRLLKASRDGSARNLKRFSGILRELKINPEKILREGGITEADLLQGTQRFVNFQAGRTTPQTVPMLMSSRDPRTRMMTQYKTFLATNSSSMRRDLAEPYLRGDYRTLGKRLAQLGLGAEIIGEVTRDLQFLALQQRNPFTQDRVAYAFRNTPGGRYIDNLLAGLGSMHGMIAYAAIVGAETDLSKQLGEFALGPTLTRGFNTIASGLQGLGDPGGLLEDITIQAARLLPGPAGPIADRAVRDSLKKPASPKLGTGRFGKPLKLEK